MRIGIVTIPHKEQAYDTCGNWFFTENGNLGITVSKMSDPRYEFLVALHELIEAKLCEHQGITQQVVDEFDKLFEAEREAGKHTPGDEPGDDPRCPYYDAHQRAMLHEHIMARELGVEWAAYEKEVASL